MSDDSEPWQVRMVEVTYNQLCVAYMNWKNFHMEKDYVWDDFKLFLKFVEGELAWADTRRHTLWLMPENARTIAMLAGPHSYTMLKAMEAKQNESDV